MGTIVFLLADERSPDPPPVTIATLFLRSMGSLLDCCRPSSGRIEIAETHAAVAVDRGSGNKVGAPVPHHGHAIPVGVRRPKPRQGKASRRRSASSASVARRARPS